VLLFVHSSKRFPLAIIGMGADCLGAQTGVSTIHAVRFVF
jgi:hypothetical protein